MSVEDVGEYKAKVSDMIELREMKSLRQKADEEEHLKIYGGLGEGIGMKTYLLTWLTRLRKNPLKLRFRIGDLDLPERRKMYTSSRVEEEDGQTCPCGKARESRTHIVAECELYKEQ